MARFAIATFGAPEGGPYRGPTLPSYQGLCGRIRLLAVLSSVQQRPPAPAQERLPSKFPCDELLGSKPNTTWLSLLLSGRFQTLAALSSSSEMGQERTYQPPLSMLVSGCLGAGRVAGLGCWARLRFRLLQVEAHVHLAVHRCRGGEMHRAPAFACRCADIACQGRSDSGRRQDACRAARPAPVPGGSEPHRSRRRICRYGLQCRRAVAERGSSLLGRPPEYSTARSTRRRASSSRPRTKQARAKA